MPASQPPSSSAAPSSAVRDMPQLNIHYVPSRLPAGIVVGLWGDAVMRQDDGGARTLQLGDVVTKGDVLLTAQNGVVEISLGGTAVATNARPGKGDGLDQLIASLDNGEIDIAPGAGLGGSEGSLQPGVVVDRIIEVVTPQEYQFAYEQAGTLGEIENTEISIASASDEPDLETDTPADDPVASSTVFVGLVGPASGAITEGETAKFTVSLSQPAATDVTVKLTYSGTATDGSDYTAVTSVTIPAGQSSVEFDLSTIDDALAEGSESITISVGEITGGGFEAIAADPAKGSVITLVTDDVGGKDGGTPGAEDTCLVSITGPASGSVTEGETAKFTVSLSQPAATDVTIKLTYSGTATDGSDYTAVTSVTIPAGQSSVDFDLSTIDDALAEGSESITISVGEITGGGFEAIAADPDKGSVTTLVTDDVGGPGGGTPGAEDTCLVSITGPASGSVTEGETAKFTVSLSQPAATDVTIKLTYSGTATDGSDYTAVTSVTIPAGQSSVDFDQSTIDDALAEGSESITISVGEITGGGFEAIAADPDKGSVTTLVTDDVGGPGGGTPGAEDTCLVSIAGPASVVEGQTSTGYTVSLSQPAATDVTIKLTYSGTATDGSDYTAVTSVTIPAGQTSTTFDLSTIDDALAEGSETITISVGEITGGGFEAIAADPDKGSVTTLVTDDVGGPGGGTPGSEDTCLVSIAGPASGSVTEGETARFTVSLSQPAATDVTIKLTYSGTATDGSDYIAVTSVTIPAGQSSVEFDLSTIDDALAEGSESITISVGEITGGGFEAIAADPDKGSVTTLVTDDVGGPGGGTPGGEDTCLVSITGPASGSVTEGETARFTVSLSQPAATDVTVKLTYSGTATDGSDYTAVTSVTIPAGQSSVDFDLSTIDDALAEGSETITVSVGEITGGGFEAIAADPDKGSVTTLVTDDVGGPGGGTPGAEDTCLVSITGPASGSVTEGETARFTVSLSQPAATDVTIKLTYSGTATDGSDYTAVTSLTIPAGQSSVDFDLSTIDDALAEGSETITVSVGEITGGGFEAIAADPAKGSVTTLVTDDVGGPGGGTPGVEDTCLVSITGPGSVVEGQTASGYTVSLSQPAATDVTVKLTYSGTATDGSDYTAVTSVTIPAGQTSTTFDLSTIDDALVEGSETITVSVGEITGGGFEAITADPTKGSITTLVTDDVGGPGSGTPGVEDTCLVSITGPGSVVEGQTASGYTVSLSQPASTDVTVKLTYSGTATDGSDYTAVTSVTIPAGQTRTTFDLNTIDDALAEGSESITISVGEITGGGFEAIAADPDKGSVTTLVTDDVGGPGGGTPGAEDTCLVSITGPGSVVEGQTASGYTVSLSQPASTDVTVKLTYSGTATDGSDYTAVTSVTIPAGQTRTTFDLSTIDDALVEGSETITVSVGEITGGGFEAIAADPDKGSVTTLVTDDVGGPGGGTPGSEDTCLVSIAGPASGSVTEGETARFAVSLSQPAATDVTIKLTYSGTATDGSDYTAVTSVTIPAGQSSVDFDLSTIDDALAEGSETITVSVGEITGGGFEAIAADPAKGSVTTLVTDDVGGPGGGTPGAEDTCLVSIAGPASGSVTEGETARFTVSLSQPAATDVTIKLTYSGTATDGSDYTAVTSVTIPAGQSSVDFDLSTIDDALAEGSETITVSVGEITDGGFEAIAADPAKGSVTTLVTDDVGGPGGGTPGAEDTCLVSITGPGTVVEGQTATGYTVSLSQPAATDVTIKLTYSGTATDGSDYTAVTSVTIPAGQSSVDFDLSTIDDALVEGSESITISVGEITGGGFEAIAADPAKGSVTTLVTDDVGGPGGGTPGAEDTCLVSIA
ncbi:catabolite regulation protein CreA, partial [Sphaerotilus sulfidivorans]